MKSADHVRLRLLGAASLDGPGADIAGVLSQPKRLTVLAYLAVQGGFVRRDVLVRLFWPDVDPDRARRTLSQAIHYLRRALGRDAIQARGVEEVGISTECIWSDVRAFEAAIAGSRWEEALELYGGELLHGLTPDHTPEFDHWLGAVRTRLSRAAVTAAATLSAARFRESDIEAAIQYQRRAAAISPLDEAVLRDYLMLLDEAGNAGLAIREFESFRTRLADEYDLEPGRETVNLVAMIRSRRPEARELEPRGAASAEPAEGMSTPPAVRPIQPVRPRSRRRLLNWIAAPVAVALAFLVLQSVPGPWAGDGTARPVVVPNRIAVLYFVPTEGKDLDHLADGITTALTDYLHGFNALDVVPTHAVYRFRQKDASFDTIRSALKTPFFVTGEVAQDGRSTRVSIELNDAVKLSVPFRRTLEFTDLSDRAVIDSVLALVTDALASAIGEQLERYRYEWGTRSEAATEYALRAEGHANEAEEYVGMGRLDLARAALALADSALDVAVSHDRNWAQPHIVRARLGWHKAFMCQLLQCDSDVHLDEGLAEVETALQLDPQNAEAWELRADLTWKAWVFGLETETAALDRAKGDAEKAVLLDPSRALAWSIQSAVAFERGNYRVALTSGRTALQKDEFAADRREILHRMFEAAFNLGEDTTAVEVCGYLHLQEKMTLHAASCELQLRAWSDLRQPDIDGAWAVLEQLKAATQPEYWESTQARVELQVAAVIARSAESDPSLVDSARHVVERMTGVAPPREALPDEALLYSAAAYVRAGLHDQARTNLQRYVQTKKTAAWHLTGRRWFETLNLMDTGLIPFGDVPVLSGPAATKPLPGG